MSAAKINDVDAPYPRRLRKSLAEAVDIAVKMLKLKGAKESAWTLQDAFDKSLGDAIFKGRKKCWLIWVILPSGHTALRAVTLSKVVADRYEDYIKNTQKIERVMVEESLTNHLYFGAFDKGQTVDPKDVVKALARARVEYAKTRKPKKSKTDFLDKIGKVGCTGCLDAKCPGIMTHEDGA